MASINLMCAREPTTTNDRFTVAVIKAGATVGHTALQEYPRAHDLIISAREFFCLGKFSDSALRPKIFPWKKRQITVLVKCIAKTN